MPDVRLPDGTIVKNLPEGTTRTALLSRVGRFFDRFYAEGGLAEMAGMEPADRQAATDASKVMGFIENGNFARALQASKTVNDVLAPHLDPNISRRGMILPYGVNKQGKAEWAVPEMALDLVRSLMLPGHAMRGGGYTPADATIAALDVGLLGAAGAAGKTAGKTAENLAARIVSMYNPPVKPARPFEADYQSGAPADDLGRLTHDIDGTPLRPGGRIVGRTVVGGADKALPEAEFDAIATAGTGAPAKVAPIPGRDVGRVSVDSVTRRPLGVAISGNLTPKQAYKVQGHEIGHVIDQLAGEIPVKGINDELRQVYNTLNTGQERTRNLTGPQHLGYKGADVPREMMAEAIRAYMADPNYLKTVAPKTAAAIRKAVNANPQVNEIVQFNSAGVPVFAHEPADDREAQ